MYDAYESREHLAKRAMEERFLVAQQRLTDEKAAHDYLIQQGNPASRLTGENIVRLERALDKARKQMEVE